MRSSARTGSYNVIMGFSLTTMLGFAAIAVDWGRVVLANAEAQHVADSAAEAAIMALKSTGSETEAQQVAERIVAMNPIGGGVGTITAFDVGEWDNSARTWDSTGSNGVRIEVGRVGANGIDLPLSGYFGWESADVRRGATAATQNLQVVLVMDVTGSWDQDNFYKARTAAVTFLDRIHAVHGSDDIIGMVTFFQRFGYEYTPFTNVEASASDNALVRDKWAALNISSLAGEYQSAWASQTSKHYACKVFGNKSNGAIPWSYWCTSGTGCYQPSKRDNFTTPSGGCFPNLPRYYSDEGGTDHTTGMSMAQTMFSERPDPIAYRAMVVLTDGEPVAYGSTSGSVRLSKGYSETRWREYKRTSAHTQAQIEADTVSLAESMYTAQNVNTWFISFVSYGAFMEDASKGDGYFKLTTDANDIIPVFDRIARSLPVAVVE